MMSATSSILESDRLPLFLSFLAFVMTFVITRVITRLIRSGRGPFRDNVSESGLHVHHAVPGVLVLVTGAFIAVGANGTAGWTELAGVLVGVGSSLVLDEFALILRLDDVYWSEEGRVSVEMVTLAIAVLGIILIGAGGNPVQVYTGEGVGMLVFSLSFIAVHLAFVMIIVAKGKYRTALFATFLPTVSMIGAWRLGRPGSRWARRFYDEDKTRRAERRAERFDRRYTRRFRRLGDLVAGTFVDPSAPGAELAQSDPVDSTR